MKSKPVVQNDRIISLDILRGFALFGILIVNMPAFHSPTILQDYYMIQYAYEGVDKYLRLFFDLFVQGKFYPIFSFLFGLGFYLLMERAASKGENVYLLFSRRMLAMLGFGLFHLVFLWSGDILHIYAIGGLLLFLFYRRRPITVLIWSFLFLAALYGLFAMEVFWPTSFYQQYVQTRQLIGAEKIDLALIAYQSGSIQQWFAYRLADEVPLILGNLISQVLAIFPLFLLGLYAGKKKLFQKIDEQINPFKWVLWGSGLVSLPLIIVLLSIQLEWITIGAGKNVSRVFFVNVSGITMSLFYISSIAILSSKKKILNRLLPLGYVGQMALSNYLGQTILTLLLVFTFNLYNQLSLAEGLLLTVCIFYVQIHFSYLWLKSYSYGPMEWLWRILTYGKVPMKR
ncbi:DUF418 domain-containing protein [Ammoniphilus sp. CFH 90114]|uniref:DUF418 domain-containing protein n=1 Tax=Ammoniphilus sp. CFH 90114 TaxID=2493665 RepID=UPI0013E95F13|nr:DUF418 domain-containing protein [Ammoniphilus sp. CFH 90114]